MACGQRRARSTWTYPAPRPSRQGKFLHPACSLFSSLPYHRAENMFFIVREEEDPTAVLYVSVRLYETQSHSQMYSLETMKRSASTPPPAQKLILSRAPSSTMLH